MGLRDELTAEVRKVFRTSWTTRDGRVVPDDASVTLGNDGIYLDATVLYADLADSTAMVDKVSSTHAAEIYKTYLHCAAKIIRSEGGAITAYDGDRIMAVFIGDAKNTTAVRVALNINFAVEHILRTEHDDFWAKIDKQAINSRVGVDTSKLLVAKTGVRGANDLVWVGRAANHAAKLASLEEFPTYISADVYREIADQVKFSDEKPSGRNMWEPRRWDAMGGVLIYGSTWHRNFL